MRGDITKAILKKIGETAVDMVDLFDVYLEAGYGASYGKIQYLLEKKEKNRLIRKKENERWGQYRKFISYLEQDGLLEREVVNKKTHFILTEKGKKKIKKEVLEKNLPNKHNYEKKKSEKYIIVIFDVPEVEKRKRKWLRETLQYLGFSMAQKSVWVGNIKLPEEFIKDIFELGLGEYVDIFEAVKSGTLRNKKNNVYSRS
ncbi:MAG: CRISPR-associated endonuclease Cas2 [Patescibacteria group bacterium]